MELKVLTASEGMILTNGEAYGKSITLGKNDSAENWHEISEAEYEAILQAELEEASAVPPADSVPNTSENLEVPQ